MCITWQGERTRVSLLAKKAKVGDFLKECVWSTVSLNGALGSWQLDDDNVVHGITVVFIPELHTLEVQLLARIVLGWNQESEAFACVRNEACTIHALAYISYDKME
jgi:hypothetical protein